MTPGQWQKFKQVAKHGTPDQRIVAMIVDSPWIPGYLGISHLDYFLDPDLWFQSNARVMREFPEITFVPSWWVEYGMAVEPSAFGVKMLFYGDHTPDVVPCLRDLLDVGSLRPADPRRDGLMPLALRLYQTQKQRIFDAGYTIPLVAARGPLCLASFLRGLTNLMTDLTEQPAAVHKLFDIAAETVIGWLRAQCDAIGGTVEGVFILDDVPGMLSRKMYLEFAHPYLKRVFDSFPKDWVKIYHNDASIRPFARDLPGLGIDVLNWSHKLKVDDLLRETNGGVRPMGNVAPLDIGVNGTPDDVTEAAREVIARASGNPLILSVGGGVSPGMPRENLLALARAWT